MKNIINKIALSFAAATIFSCTAPPLERVPQDTNSNSTFWTSENDARLALNGCYSYLAYAYGNSYNDGSADNAYCQYPWESDATTISEGNITPASLSAGNYSGKYQSIRGFNTYLDNIGKISMDENLKKRFIAEAKVLRAMTYFDLIRLYGAVPLLTSDYTSPQETAVVPTPEPEVVDFIINELAAAQADLPLTYSGGLSNEKGRITKGAAWALKARVELDYNKFADAAASAKKVQELGVYHLFRGGDISKTKDDFSNFVDFASTAEKQKFNQGVANYEQLFWAANDDNSEVIITSQAINNSSYEWGNGLNTLLPPSDLGGWSSITPTIELVNSYWDKTGHSFNAPSVTERASNYNGGNPNAAYFAEFHNRDTRLYASILFPTSPWENASPGYLYDWGSSYSWTGYNFRKLVDTAYLSTEWDGAQDFPILRYAEVLLIYAEAKNEVSGPDSSVYEAINDIRDRSGMPAVDQTVYNTKEKMRELIRNERRIELAGEGQRYFDIRRWGIADQVMKTVYDITNNITQERGWQNKFVKLPYPQAAVDKNPNLGAAQTAKGY
ncbi:putative outer membrane starch-binding protein [Flavobacterium cutihirudinis]|uniref:Putative outer membrane starch-binding protein n=1 Tax=Flavobacterium cutihirudinis TaxID=1265740 RepID=A0A3D9FTH5_9FLAO|nr:RagB/SusD family nutrient uptake outer membrane protein [Flavobacterium cutihirudinis]RED23865.1 putative outer membrane starch-binding protein [Flavobacterium cutihirudinis]